MTTQARHQWQTDFAALTGHAPLRWQARLFDAHLSNGECPAALDIPTGLGKTSVMALWLIARAYGAKLPRRLVYVVDRRAVVDQATDVAQGLRDAVKTGGAAASLRAALGLGEGQDLAISTLRGQFADNREWLADPAAPAIIIGTVDMVGSRLLFSGYGVSRGMRPFHAGLLGADTLIVLDEAHLVPPFEKLIEQIETGAEVYGPKEAEDRDLIPKLRLMSLSATGGAREGTIFRLQPDDADKITDERLSAPKALSFRDPADEKGLPNLLAQEAWDLCAQGQENVRVIVFCNSRDAAQKTLEAIASLAKADKNAGRPETKIELELFVGARRVKEREDAKNRLTQLGYIGAKTETSAPCFVVATSAGEVGVDLNADHLVCDLVSFDRMVQRFGRVNRRGERSDARLVVIEEKPPTPKKADAPTEHEQVKLANHQLAHATKALLQKLPEAINGLDSSPGALMRLKDSLDPAAIRDASTPAPLRPALTRAEVDAWSMTSLKEHTGRAEVGPWLRGWVEERAQTTIVWRTHLPMQNDGTALPAKDVEAFFEAAPPSTNEQLDTETWRVMEWLKKRVEAHRRTNASTAPTVPDLFGFALSPSGDFRAALKLSDFQSTDKKGSDRAWERLERTLNSSVLIVAGTFAGLHEGLLNETVADPPTCGDTSGDFATGFTVGTVNALNRANDQRFAFTFPVEFGQESETPTQWLVVEGRENQDGKALAKAMQLLVEHQDWTGQAARRISERLCLTQTLAAPVEIAARLHDEGKKAANWQAAFKAPRDGIYGKTKGPILQNVLDGYRHEFGSLPYAQEDMAFKALAPEMQDLVLHLIAAHHGNARPVIDTCGCPDAPPLLLQDRARDVALRYARLQKRFGPWGLAWLEALVRAADQQASRNLETQANG